MRCILLVGRNTKIQRRESARIGKLQSHFRSKDGIDRWYLCLSLCVHIATALGYTKIHGSALIPETPIQCNILHWGSICFWMNRWIY